MISKSSLTIRQSRAFISSSFFLDQWISLLRICPVFLVCLRPKKSKSSCLRLRTKFPTNISSSALLVSSSACHSNLNLDFDDLLRIGPGSLAFSVVFTLVESGIYREFIFSCNRLRSFSSMVVSFRGGNLILVVRLLLFLSISPDPLAFFNSSRCCFVRNLGVALSAFFALSNARSSARFAIIAIFRACIFSSSESSIVNGSFSTRRDLTGGSIIH
mmetsp:Transcript_41480/g.66655  ORF Transcript_41480/g.66655 Transcript_41480/m.66655 type:complete len:216 (-) Transcript_41480:482-1129(-)